MILHLRKERQYGAVRLSYFLKQYHQVFVSAPTILRVFKEHLVPGQSVQVDVKFLRGRSGRF